MSENENAALIRSLYDAFARRDLEFILARLSDDVDWVVEGPAVIPYCGRRKGPAEVQGFFIALATHETNQNLTISTVLASGDRVACSGRYQATVASTGKSYDTPVAHFFTVSGGKVSRLEETMDTAAIADAYRTSVAASRG